MRTMPSFPVRTASLCAAALMALVSVAPAAHAQSAYDACDQLPRGQRSYCMISAQENQAIAQARSQNQDATVNLDYNTANDTPAQQQAKQAYQSAADACAELPSGQRSFCMEQARTTYSGAMGW